MGHVVPAAERPVPDRTPPRGVPRWLWPPPGAAVTRVVLRERIDEDGVAAYDARDGAPPERKHLRALQWLLADYEMDERRAGGCSFEGEVLLEIARTEMAGGRVGHAYALNGGPLGAPSAEAARGILWRYVSHQVREVTSR